MAEFKTAIAKRISKETGLTFDTIKVTLAVALGRAFENKALDAEFFVSKEQLQLFEAAVRFAMFKDRNLLKSIGMGPSEAARLADRPEAEILKDETLITARVMAAKNIQDIDGAVFDFIENLEQHFEVLPGEVEIFCVRAIEKEKTDARKREEEMRKLEDKRVRDRVVQIFSDIGAKVDSPAQVGRVEENNLESGADGGRPEDKKSPDNEDGNVVQFDPSKRKPR